MRTAEKRRVMVEGKRMEEEAVAAAAEEEKKEKLKLRRLQVRGNFVVVCIAFDAVCFLCGWNGMMMMITPITMLLVSLSSSSFAHYHHLARMPSCHSPCNSHASRFCSTSVPHSQHTHPPQDKKRLTTNFRALVFATTAATKFSSL